MKFAIYVRVSMVEQNLENQIIPLKEYAERMGWTYELFSEKESTRKTRPTQYALYNRLLKKEFDGVLIYKFDRWARSTTELVNHLKEFEARRVRFVSYSENIDLGTPAGKLMFTIIAAMAEFERELIRERTLAGLARARARGKKLGRPSKSGKVYKRPSRAKVAECMAKGMTVRETAKELGTSRYWSQMIMSEIRHLNEGGFSLEK